MITNFENITKPLTEFELSNVSLFVDYIKTRSKDNPVKAPQICADLNIADVTIRKIVNHIRVNGVIPVIATTSGYYMSYDSDEIQKQIRSLRERASSIENCAKGLEGFINQ